jgi:catechol 2,3-dioxygenase-like lactoylglutathione lyase family enzyme
MGLEVRRMIIFAKDMAAMAAFYGDKLGLPVAGGDVASGFVDFDAGALRLALHNGGTGETARKATKIVFYAPDVAAARAELVGRGVKLGKVKLANDLQLCDGKDPEGHAFEISNRP